MLERGRDIVVKYNSQSGSSLNPGSLNVQGLREDGGLLSMRMGDEGSSQGKGYMK